MEHYKPASPVRFVAVWYAILVFNGSTIDIHSSTIIEPQLDAAAVHVEFAGDQFHVLVLLFLS